MLPTTSPVPVQQPCALDILEVTVNTDEILPGNRIHSMFNDAIEAAALEYLESWGCIPNLDTSFSDGSILLEIDMLEEAGSNWEILIQDKHDGPFTNNIIWPEDEDKTSAQFYHALNDFLQPLIREISLHPKVGTKACIVVHADLRSISAHQRLQMIKTHAKIMNAYKDKDKA